MLHVDGLTYRLGERLLIDNATVALPTGGRVGVVGRNGRPGAAPPCLLKINFLRQSL